MTGLVHVYTGDGKGKTTAALGLSFRALGRGFKVYFIQFMKGNSDYGEVRMAAEQRGLEVTQFGRDEFVDRDNPTEEDIRLAREGMKFAGEVMKKLPDEGRHVLMVLDEVNVAVDFNLVRLEELVEIIAMKPQDMELVITGRGARNEVLDYADYVTEMREIKHPYKKGIFAREGIEY